MTGEHAPDRLYAIVDKDRSEPHENTVIAKLGNCAVGIIHNLQRIQSLRNSSNRTEVCLIHKIGNKTHLLLERKELPDCLVKTE